jgi:hypothetical protein
VGWQLAHGAEDGVPVGVGEAHAVNLGRHLERGRTHRAEIRVSVEDGRQQGGLHHLLEPVATHPGGAEDPFEVWIQSLQVEQGLVDVEDDNVWHWRISAESARSSC